LIGAALTVMMLTLEDLLAIFFLIGDGYNIQMLVWSRLRVELTPELHALATVIFVFSATVVIFLTTVLEREKQQLR
jgi:ABC-type spermidine/putrescine transport system permease subunit II